MSVFWCHTCGVRLLEHESFYCAICKRRNEREPYLVMALTVVVVMIVWMAFGFYGRWRYGNWDCGLPGADCATRSNP